MWHEGNSPLIHSLRRAIMDWYFVSDTQVKLKGLGTWGTWLLILFIKQETGALWDEVTWLKWVAGWEIPPIWLLLSDYKNNFFQHFLHVVKNAVLSCFKRLREILLMDIPTCRIIFFLRTLSSWTCYTALCLLLVWALLPPWNCQRVPNCQTSLWSLLEPQIWQLLFSTIMPLC